MSKGVLYIGMGKQFIHEARRSAKSLKKSNPSLNSTLVTDRNITLDSIDNVIVNENAEYSYADKPFNMHLLPYDQTLFLDTDTYIYSDISELFGVLKNFDIAAAHNSNRTAFNIGDIPDAFPEYNTGVVLLENNDKVQNFLSNWKSVYLDASSYKWPNDQPAFRKAIYESDLRIATLPPEYNCVLRTPGHAIDEIKIFHSRLIDIETPGAPKYFGFDVKDVAGKINRNHGHRIYYGMDKFTIKNPPWDPLRTRLIRSIRQDGIAKTISKSGREIKRILNQRIDKV